MGRVADEDPRHAERIRAGFAPVPGLDGAQVESVLYAAINHLQQVNQRRKAADAALAAFEHAWDAGCYWRHER
jgi:hypothetical protein